MATYVGSIWTGSGPGVRIAVPAASRAEAEAVVRAEHGAEADFTLWNEAEAARPAPIDAPRTVLGRDDEQRSQRCVERLFEERFEFLAERGARVIDEVHSAHRLRIYAFERLTFEVALERRDSFAALMVGEMVDGVRPPGFIVHEGRRVRRNLPDAMTDTGLDGAEAIRRFRAVHVFSGPDAIVARLELIAAVLEPSVDHLLAHPDEIFPPAP